VTNNAPALNTDQQNAMVDLVFNMGPTPLQTHDVWTDVVNGNLNQVPADIQTLRAGGGGIVQRCANEAAMFTNGVYPTQCY
jgi:GH24 family phage-related lysozyme (muramidase)